MYAAVNGKCDVVTDLISLGADVNIQTTVSHFLCHDTDKYSQNKMTQDYHNVKSNTISY